MNLKPFTTRKGGASVGQYASFNTGFQNGDSYEAVYENFRRICSAINIDEKRLVFGKQTHTNNVRCVTNDDIGKGIIKPLDYDNVDGLISNLHGVGLVTQYADCTPLMFCDTKKRVIATSHAGWRGTAAQIGKVTVDKMVENLIKMLSEREEDTYVIFYGDHLPSLFVEVSDGMTHEQKYSTPYFTWNNMGIKKAEKTSDNEDIKALADTQLFKLSTVMCNELGIDGSFMNKFHRVYSDTNAYSSEFSFIQYYKMYDEAKYSDFGNDDYEIGLKPLIIKEITNTGKEEFTIKGSGFTRDTYFCINNKTVYNLKYVDENTLILSAFDDDVEVNDKISLRIIGEKLGNVLKESKHYEWGKILS